MHPYYPYVPFFFFQRNAADQILRDLQNNPDMWLQVVHILQNSHNLNTKFFALQVSFRTSLVSHVRFLCNSIKMAAISLND